MPNRSKGARLWLRPAWGTEKAVWLVRDGSKRISTGCCPEDRRGAEQFLADYIAEKYRPPREHGRDPSQIAIADVLSVYAVDKAPSLKRPREFGQRMRALLEFFQARKLSEINGAICRNYVEARGSISMARRELEDLRAAINHHCEEKLCDRPVKVTLPPKSQPRQRFLTRQEAAGLIRAAWRYREIQKGKETDRRTRRHVARFVLVGLYTGSRSGAICGAALSPAVGRGYVDLEKGLFHRRKLGAAETKKRQPTIRIPDRLLVHMRRWARLGISTSAVVEFEGRPIKSVRKAFARAASDAGLAGVTPHILRHTAASWAMQNGADLYKSADFLGMTVEILQSVYGHLRPDDHKEVGDAITRR